MSKFIFKSLGASNQTDKERAYLDYYATDPKAVETLLERESFSTNVLECCTGGGHIAEVLKKNGHNVTCIDIVQRDYPLDIVTDFMKYNIPFNGDIVTNVPYGIALQMIEHCLDLITNGSKLAVFLRIQFLEGKKRYAFFQENPPKTVYVYSGRMGCATNGNFSSGRSTSAICFCWFVWEKGYKGDTIVKWILT